jgi:hypothetical protein
MKNVVPLLFILSTLACLGDDVPYGVTHQSSYFYIVNIVFFDAIPPVAFTLKDFTRTNTLLEKQIYALSGKQYSKDKPLNAYVIPEFDNEQCRVIIYSGYPLTALKIRNITQFIENSMCTRK